MLFVIWLAEVAQNAQFCPSEQNYVVLWASESITGCKTDQRQARQVPIIPIYLVELVGNTICHRNCRGRPKHPFPPCSEQHYVELWAPESIKCCKTN